ncbi:MAG: aa3-type cytochrome c oxidase subunit IV [Amaricoccus sp.]|uniref:aa3-type cytochrome c oxidase subunit IV n=1 Tax=Amaricoccus sp. TaxID=1872485 RepID=UPI0039E39ABE
MASESHGHVGHAAAHVPAINDAAEHQRTFESFIRFWVYVFGFAALLLIFIALVNA